MDLFDTDIIPDSKAPPEIIKPGAVDEEDDEEEDE